MAQVLYDDKGEPVTVGEEGAAPTAPVTRRGFLPVALDDGGLSRFLKSDASGRLEHVLYDPSGNPISVKPASTSPTTTDEALVVVLSPNQQAIPVTASPATSTADISFGLIQLAGGSSGSLNPVRATPYTEQTTNAQRSMASSSASDTSAGVGARTVEITYLTATGAGPFTETITLNGTTPVNTTATDICFIEDMAVVTSGTTGTNVGIITLYAATGGGGGTIGTIGIGTIVAAVGDGRTLWAHHYVPASATMNVTGIAVGASAQTTFHLRSKGLTAPTATEMVVSGFLNTSQAFQRNYGSPILVEGPSRVLAYGVPSTNNVQISASFDFFES